MLGLKKLKKFTTRYSYHVYSMDFHKIPADIRRQALVDDSIFDVILQIPYIRMDEGRDLMVNSAFDDDDSTMRELLCALDHLPTSLLRDINESETKRFGTASPDSIHSENVDQLHRNIVRLFLPDVLWAHGVDIKSNFDFLNH